MLTDRYELTMLQAALRSGAATRTSVFEVFARHLPDRRRYGVVAGTGRLLADLAEFRFSAAELQWLTSTGVIDEATREWLEGYRFNGDVDGYREGELYFPGSPVLVVRSTFAEAVVLETLVLSVLNHDSAIASAAARMVCAAGRRPCIEMGSRRTHERAAVAAARAAYLVGFETTSNLTAGQRYGIPTAGTSAHAFTLVHDDERSAFAAQVAALGAGTTLLVDTYDIETAIRTAVEVAGPGLGAIRIDSGDLGEVAVSARKLLDELGATDTRIVVTSDLDEHALAALATAPVDAYGVGTAVATGSGAPTAGFVYKLVARATSPDGPLEPVAKTSIGKVGRGGVPVPARRLTGGRATAEVIHVGGAITVRGDERPLHVPLVRKGEVVGATALDDARALHRAAMAELPAEALRLSPGPPAIPTLVEEATQ
jgi:nicotinate phosphoribosyltransferase